MGVWAECGRRARKQLTDTRTGETQVERWGGEDSNLRPADYESDGARATPSVWCRLVLSSPGQEALTGPFVLSCVVLCVPVR
jgi:hypothetical protein